VHGGCLSYHLVHSLRTYRFSPFLRFSMLKKQPPDCPQWDVASGVAAKTDRSGLHKHAGSKGCCGRWSTRRLLRSWPRFFLALTLASIRIRGLRTSTSTSRCSRPGCGQAISDRRHRHRLAPTAVMAGSMSGPAETDLAVTHRVRACGRAVGRRWVALRPDWPAFGRRPPPGCG